MEGEGRRLRHVRDGQRGELRRLQHEVLLHRSRTRASPTTAISHARPGVGCIPPSAFVWWTIPIETSSGNTNRQAFNDQVRAYARANGKLLFDIADIEAHNAADQKRTDTSGRELMWREWTTTAAISTSAQRVATAWWWLMAQIASRAGQTLSISDVTVTEGDSGSKTTDLRGHPHSVRQGVATVYAGATPGALAVLTSSRRAFGCRRRPGR